MGSWKVTYRHLSRFLKKVVDIDKRINPSMKLYVMLLAGLCLNMWTSEAAELTRAQTAYDSQLHEASNQAQESEKRGRDLPLKDTKAFVKGKVSKADAERLSRDTSDSEREAKNDLCVEKFGSWYHACPRSDWDPLALDCTGELCCCIWMRF